MNPPRDGPAYEPELPSRRRSAARTDRLPDATTPTPVGERESDVVLVRRMADGDEDALGRFYDRWLSLVAALVARLLGDADEVDDVVEETFWQAWRQAGRYEPARGAIATWITTIARSRALDRVRARRRRREESWSQLASGSADDAERSPESAPGDDPQVGAEAADRRARIIAALGALPGEQRQAIELAYFGGLSQSEIAARTGQPLGTIKTRVRLALEKLRERLSALREEGM